MVSKSFPSVKVIHVLDRLAEERGLPGMITVDNGPEYTSKAIEQWPQRHRVIFEYIIPGKTTENGFVESFNGKFREEGLDQNWFKTIQEAKIIIETWRQDYNKMRPRSALGYMTPEEFAKSRNNGSEKSLI